MGVERNYHLFVPNAFAGLSIIFLFHGYNRTNDDVLGLNGQQSPYEVWLDITERENIIVIVPNSFDNGFERKGWNDCRSNSSTNSNEDDVAFTRDLLELAVAKYGAAPLAYTLQALRTEADLVSGQDLKYLKN